MKLCRTECCVYMELIEMLLCDVTAHYPADNPAGIIVGSAVAVVICMIIVVAMIVIFIKRYAIKAASSSGRQAHYFDYNLV